MGLGNWGEELQNAAGAFFGSEYLRDYRHASKIFRSNSYANAPKFKFLFHTYFNINADAYPEAPQQNIGILVKDIKLPSYSFQTDQKNQYNRKRIIQTKIKYEPITVSFHDDNLNTINKVWYAYYTYYYKDAAKPNVMFAGNRGSATQQNGVDNATQSTMADYNERDIYKDDLKGNVDWGYIGESLGPDPSKKVPFFQNITVFGFNQHNFTAYTLINPIITGFSHDTYSYAESGGLMQNSMTIDYETVVYNEGAIDGRNPGDIVTGFGDPANYDLTDSPINKPGARGTILGQGGLIDAAGGFIDSLTGNPPDIFGAIKTAGTAYNTFKNIDLKSTLEQELKADIVNVVRDSTVAIRNINFNTPANGQTPSSVGTANSKTVGLSAPTPPDSQEVRTAGKQIP